MESRQVRRARERKDAVAFWKDYFPEVARRDVRRMTYANMTGLLAIRKQYPRSAT